MKIKDKIITAGIKIGSLFTDDVSQKEADKILGEPCVTDGMPELLRKAAAQGAVLLKNDGVLPFAENSVVSVFGRVQRDWFFTGYGSGGDVKKPYGVNLLDGMRGCETLCLNEELARVYEKWCGENEIDHGVWGQWPRFYPEMELDEETVRKASRNSDCAVYVIGRSSGEDRENAAEKGSFYLTDSELRSLDVITKYFKSVTVLLNIGSIIDLSWVEGYSDKIGAVMIVWQGGMESGNAVCDLLSGKVSPSGKLADTIAKKLAYYPSSSNFGNKDYNEYAEDIFVGYRYFETFYPEQVLYPLGFGLSYTKFDIALEKCEKAKRRSDRRMYCYEHRRTSRL